MIRTVRALVLLAGCVGLGYDALYPPRRERLHAVNTAERGPSVETFRYRHSDARDPDREIPRTSLFRDNPHFFDRNRDNSVQTLTEIDVGRLVAEALLILAATGVLVAVLSIFADRRGTSV